VSEVEERPMIPYSSKNFVIDSTKVFDLKTKPKTRLTFKWLKMKLIHSFESWLLGTNEFLQTEDSGFLIIPMSK